MRVLIVDDDAQVRALIRLSLAGEGHEVAEAGDGAAAIRQLRARGADVVLCDLFMPECDGLEVLREVRRDFPGVRVVAMSGGGCQGQVDMMTVARHLGADAVLPKPFRTAALVDALGHAAGAKAAE